MSEVIEEINENLVRFYERNGVFRGEQKQILRAYLTEKEKKEKSGYGIERRRRKRVG